MHAHRIDIFDRANDDAVVILVTHHLHFELFPAQHRFFQQDLRRRRHFEAVGDNLLEFLPVIGDAAAGTTQRERRPDNGRITNIPLLLERFFHRVSDFGRRHLKADLRHGLAEQLTIFGHIDCLA